MRHPSPPINVHCFPPACSHLPSGIPVGQQILCFAGRDLKDHLSLGDHDLQQFTLSDEVWEGRGGKRLRGSHGMAHMTSDGGHLKVPVARIPI